MKNHFVARQVRKDKYSFGSDKVWLQTSSFQTAILFLWAVKILFPEYNFQLHSIEVDTESLREYNYIKETITDGR